MAKRNKGGPPWGPGGGTPLGRGSSKGSFLWQKGKAAELPPVRIRKVTVLPVHLKKKWKRKNGVRPIDVPKLLKQRGNPKCIGNTP